MRRTLRSSLIVLALGVVVAGCDRADERRSEAPPPTTPGVPITPGPAAPKSVDPKLSNSDLENAVRAKLSADEELRTANLDVDANASKNEVTNSGTVQSQDDRNKAVELAKDAHFGITVNNEIDVKPAS